MIKQARFKQFCRSRRGNFATMFALASVPMLAGVGMMIDYTNLDRQHSHLQNAVDAAVLYAATEHEHTDSLPATDEVLQFLQSNFVGPIEGIVLEIRDDEIYLEATTNTPALFLNRIGDNRFLQVADATVPVVRIVDPYEIVLVLDTTTSMSFDGKMDSLKTVASQFIDDIYAGLPTTAPAGFLKVGIVPFNTYVNVGLHNRSAPWIDVASDVSKTECKQVKPVIARTNCQMIDHVLDGVETQYEHCDYTYGPEETVCAQVGETWHGCVGSRVEPLNIDDGSYSSRIPGVMNAYCGAALTELTTDSSSVKGDIHSLTTQGNTYIAHGVMWGLRVLSPFVPFKDAAPYDTGTRKVMIVMTDGDNTVAPRPDPTNTRYHDNPDSDLANANTLRACAEARSEKITIYTISFGDAVSAASEAMLRECAGSAHRFFDADNASELQDAFDDIVVDLNIIKLTS